MDTHEQNSENRTSLLTAERSQSSNPEMKIFCENNTLSLRNRPVNPENELVIQSLSNPSIAVHYNVESDFPLTHEFIQGNYLVYYRTKEYFTCQKLVLN
ncbi:MAG: hypothetical protein MI784_15890 [Cytophagales bacterium]|nr:hypothetical protein [Cytophagales bacterium]